MSTETGGPAFPSTNSVSVGGITTNGYPGMTLRDYFAAAAMGRLHIIVPEEANLAGLEFVDALAKRAYQVADAMLAERDK